MAEQPNNVINIDTYRVPEGTRFDSDSQVDLQKGDPRLFSLEAARKAVEAANALQSPSLAERDVETIPAIENAHRVGLILRWIRSQEITDDAARKAA